MSYCIYERDGVEQNCGIKGYVIQFLIRYSSSSAGGLALGVPCTIYISYLSLLETICYKAPSSRLQSRLYFSLLDTKSLYSNISDRDQGTV